MTTDLKKSLLENMPKSLCVPAKKRLKFLENIGELLAFYKSGIDFCFDENYPTKAQLLEFGGIELERQGFYIDKSTGIYNVSTIVALGSSQLKIENSGYNVCELYAKDDACLHIKVKEHSYLMIDLFDNAYAEIHASDEAKVIVNVYGNAKVVTLGDVSVKINLKHTDKYENKKWQA